MCLLVEETIFLLGGDRQLREGVCFFFACLSFCETSKNKKFATRTLSQMVHFWRGSTKTL